MLVPQMVVIYFSMLKYWLIMDLTIELFCEFQISTQTIAESKLDDTLIMWDFKVRTISLKMHICWIVSITISEIIGWLVLSAK